MANEVEFKSQFQPALLKGGSVRVKHKDGTKHYVAEFIQGRFIVHASNKQFKTSSATILYANTVLARYARLHARAQLVFVLNRPAVRDEPIKEGES